MLRLESALSRNPKSAKDHFLYANGLYNKSWFGNFPMSSVLYRSSSLVKGEKPPKTMDLTQAQEEYELALKYALDEEFRAKIAYQLLKIKFNQAIINSEKYDQNSWSMPHIGEGENGTASLIKLLNQSKDFPESLKDFRSEYEHTDYAKKVIKKCITFKYF